MRKQWITVGSLGLLLGLLLTFLACKPGERPCQVDNDCLLGTFCNTAQGVCTRECTSTPACPADHRCDTSTGRCVIATICTKQANKVCRNGHMVWLDSCGNIGEEAQDCGQSGCTDAGCSQVTVRCGDGQCNGLSEDCASCPQDCKCLGQLTCDFATATCKEQTPCGDGTCNNAQGETCASCPQDCTCQGNNVCNQSTGQCLPPSDTCGNGTCELGKGEGCTTCAKDCTCQGKQTCQNNACVEPNSCPNGVCEPGKGEDCTTCAKDCGCGGVQTCINGKCEANKQCNNNNTCEPQSGETCTNCPGDCGCKAGETCSNNKCISSNPCGDGTCATGQGENCSSCPKDCKCPTGQTCKANNCEVANSCGNGFCEPSQKENCSTCAQDCKCSSGQQCNAGSCQASCGNGTCEASKGENCSSCPKDCACKSFEACKSGTCERRCPSGWGSFWTCDSSKTKRQRCGVLNNYKEETVSCKYGCKENTLNDACCVCRPGSKRCAGTGNDDLEECQSDCMGWKKIQTCDNDDNHFCGPASLKCICYTYNQCSKVGDYRCSSGGERQFCTKNSTSGCMHWRKSALPCKGSTPLCIEGKCCSCKPGSKRCNGKSIEQCNADCKTWKVIQTCSTGVCCGNRCGCI